MSEVVQIKKPVPFNRKKELLVADHKTSDIVDAIHRYHKKCRNDYDQISKDFWFETPEDTAKALFRFLKCKVEYDVEPEHYQTVKTPGAILKQLHGDCKHYASFITGVCCSLERQGLPIHARYRFVSDKADRDIHHVFAVVKDKKTGREYWCDPVLMRFDERPKFYNIKDTDMAKIGELYAISGTGIENTYPGGPHNLPMVFGIGAKKKKENIFKKIAHGIKVNNANIKKGIKVNTANIQKGVKTNLANAKTLALKVSIAPARNAFLLLLDLNAFNLATRLYDSWNNKAMHDKLVKKWKEMGGDENKLRNAINNGVRHKAKVHKKVQPKKLSGDLEAYLNGHIMMRATRRGNPLRVYRPEYSVPTYFDAYNHPYDDRGQLPKVSGIGVAPIALPAVLALATAIIAALKMFIKPSPKDDADMQQGAKDGVNKLVVDASDAIDAGDIEGGSQIMDQAVKGQQVLSMQAGVDRQTGAPVIQVDAVNHPQLQNAGMPNPPGYYANDDIDPTDPQSLYNVPKNVATDVMAHVIDPIKNTLVRIWEGYKVPILLVGTGVVVFKIMTRKKGRKR